MSERVIKVDNKKPRIQSELFLAIQPEQYKFICLSDRAFWVARFLVGFYRGWRTIFGDYVNLELFKIADVSEYAEFDAALEEWENIEMSTCDGLQSIADAIAALSPTVVTQNNTNNCSGCSGCSGGAGQTRPVQGQQTGIVGSVDRGDGTATPIFGTEQPITLPESGYPEGYASVGEYKADKCEQSWLIVEGVIDTLRGLASLGVVNFVALTGLIIATLVGAVIVPPVALPLLCAAIGALSVNVAILAEVANQIEDNDAEFVCVIYNAEGVEEAITALADLVSAIVGGLSLPAPVGAAVGLILGVLFSADTVNQAFKKLAHLRYPNAECSACSGCSLNVNIGSLVSSSNGVYELQSAAASSYQAIDIYWVSTPGTSCSGNAKITVLSASGYVNSGNPNDDDWTIISLSGTVYSDDDMPVGQYDWVRFNVVGNPSSPFTVQVEIVPNEV